MDKERLNHIINNPQNINDNDIESLSGIVEYYPYFTIAQALLAIGIELKDDNKSNRQLRLAAAMVPNRNTLRHLLAESKDKLKSCDLPDELGNEGQQITDSKQQTLETIVIPEIDLNKSV